MTYSISVKGHTHNISSGVTHKISVKGHTQEINCGYHTHDLSQRSHTNHHSVGS